MQRNLCQNTLRKVTSMYYDEDDNPYDLSEDEIHPHDEDEVHYQSLEDKLREVGMSIHDFI